MPTGPRVVITDCDLGATDEQVRRLEVELGAAVSVHHCRTTDEVLAVARDADALMVQWAPIDRTVLAQLERCRLIARYGIGIDMIDVGAATEYGIFVANVADYCLDEVATHTVALLLALHRRLPEYSVSMRAGHWQAQSSPPPARIDEVVLGLIGVGRIGSRVARTFRAMGATVIAHDPVAVPSGDVELVSLTDLLDRADLISLHCPLTETTRGLIDNAALARMKSTAILVNTARGPLVDRGALVDALATGQIAAAGIDVFDVEPLLPDDPLRRTPGLLLTPHAAWYSGRALEELRAHNVRNVIDFFQGRRVDAILNPGARG